MTKWVRATPLTVPEGGSAAAVLNFPAPPAGSWMVVLAMSTTVLSTPSGASVLESVVGGSGSYAWAFEATGSETSVSTNRSVASGAYAPVFAVVLEFAPGSSLIAARDQINIARSGVAADPLAGLSATPKLLLHWAAWDGTGPTLPAPTLTWGDATVTEVWGGQAGTTLAAIRGALGYLEDSTLTSWGPTTLLSDSAGLSSSDRITLAISAAEPPEPEPLDTPVVTVLTETDPSTTGADDGEIELEWDAVPNAGRYAVGIADGHGQTTGFITVEEDATSPYVITNLSAGNYTVAVKAFPAE